MKWPRLWYAALYVLLLFGFAYLYSKLPGEHFYHANVGREPVVGQCKEQISRELQKAIIDTFQGHNGGDPQWFGNWGIDPRAFKVGFLEAAEKGRDVEISFKLTVVIIDKSKPKSMVYADPMVTFSAMGGSDAASIGAAGNGEQLRIKQVTVSLPELPGEKDLWGKELNNRLPMILFPTRSGIDPRKEGNSGPKSGEEEPSIITMPISKTLDSEVINLAKGIQGDPSRLDGHFWRMFYLSAVTITTLGFGDIAPLTPSARNLILAEAVLGIIVLGLLISGAAPKRKELLPPPTNARKIG